MIDNPPPQADLRGWLAGSQGYLGSTLRLRALLPVPQPSGQPSVAVCWLGKAAFGSLHNPNFLHRSWD